MSALRRCATALALCLGLAACSTLPDTDRGVFFDDFSQPDVVALQRSGWAVRDRAGHPGIPGAAWGDAGIALLDDPQRPGNRLLRLSAQTDGTPPGTRQAQLCHARKYLAGTYAARVRFNDMPVRGADGDVVIQTFYAVAPLRFDFDPQFSEIDWEYLPNGGWGDGRTRLYGVSWQTVRIEPWLTFNQAHERFGSMDGWHVLLMQVANGRVRLFVDGELQAEHGGRNYPVSPMAIQFNLWFAPGGLLAAGGAPRVYEQDVDWVFHARDVVLTPAQVEARVQAFRNGATARADSVPAPVPALSSHCDF